MYIKSDVTINSTCEKQVRIFMFNFINYENTLKIYKLMRQSNKSHDTCSKMQHGDIYELKFMKNIFIV